MLYCKICKKSFHYLGYPRHRQRHIEEIESAGYVHNGHRRRIRHKCSACGKVRFEFFMIPLGNKTRWNNDRWACADVDDDSHNNSRLNVY